MPSSDLVYVLAAPDLEELGVAGEAVLDGVGDFRVRIDGTSEQHAQAAGAAAANAVPAEAQTAGTSDDR